MVHPRTSRSITHIADRQIHRNPVSKSGLDQSDQSDPASIDEFLPIPSPDTESPAPGGFGTT